MAERIRSYQSGMRDYLSAITQGQEEERTLLAHELHDVSIQGLIALKQRGQMALKTLGSDPARYGAPPGIERPDSRRLPAGAG